MGTYDRIVNLDLRTGGASVVFVLVLLSYTVQTELAQHVQHSYRKPYSLFYLTHSGYSLLLPLHLLALRVLCISIPESFSILRSVLRVQFAVTATSVSSIRMDEPSASSITDERPNYGRSLSRASLSEQVTGQTGSGRFLSPKPRRRTSLKRLLVGKDSRGRNLWKWKLAKTVISLTFLIALPALSWYAAVPLTSMTDITAIYNVFAFWAYLLAIKFLGEPPTRAKLASVLIAVCGVFVIAYGDSSSKSDNTTISSNSRMWGNLLALFGSVAYAWYEVWYKIHVALPDSDEDEILNLEDEADALLTSADEVEATTSHHSLSADMAEPSTLPTSVISLSLSIPSPSVTNPSSATFLLYSNFITTLIGVTTLLLLWIPIPLLHWIGWEEFELPPSEAILPIAGIVMSGVFFNAGFMVLLSLWGPVVASVGNLCTLVLVAVADTVISSNAALSSSTLVGSGMVVAAFAGLILDARWDRENRVVNDADKEINVS